MPCQHRNESWSAKYVSKEVENKLNAKADAGRKKLRRTVSRQCSKIQQTEKNFRVNYMCWLQMDVFIGSPKKTRETAILKNFFVLKCIDLLHVLEDTIVVISITVLNGQSLER